MQMKRCAESARHREKKTMDATVHWMRSGNAVFVNYREICGIFTHNIVSTYFLVCVCIYVCV